MDLAEVSLQTILFRHLDWALVKTLVHAYAIILSFQAEQLVLSLSNVILSIRGTLNAFQKDIEIIQSLGWNMWPYCWSWRLLSTLANHERADNPGSVPHSVPSKVSKFAMAPSLCCLVIGTGVSAVKQGSDFIDNCPEEWSKVSLWIHFVRQNKKFVWLSSGNRLLKIVCKIKHIFITISVCRGSLSACTIRTTWGFSGKEPNLFNIKASNTNFTPGHQVNRPYPRKQSRLWPKKGKP